MGARTDYPKIRPVNVFPVQVSGRKLLCLQDPQNISEKALFLPPPVYFIVSHFDGQHSLRDIQAEFMRNFGEILFSEKIQEIVDELDENFFLEGERFQEALRQKEEAFRRAPVREAAFAGKSYEKEPELLKTQLATYFDSPEGPGGLGQKGAGDGLRGLIAPHIDFQRGGVCYAFAHREIWKEGPSDCFVILGTAHLPMQKSFALTRKDFKTPLGTLEVTKELVDALQSKCSYDLFRDEGVHRTEHSIEFQCIFLRFLIPEPRPVKILPILCGSFHDAVLKKISPMEIGPVGEFVEALQECLGAHQGRVCLIASADLAHVGPQFGDRRGLGEYERRVLEDEDRTLLGYVEQMDGEGFFESISREEDRRRICGLPAIYVLMKVLERGQGKLLKYGQAFTSETQSVVTFASLAFY